MKIGIISIGNDSLELFRFLQRYNHEYVVYYDADAWPLGDKTRDRQQEILKNGYTHLLYEGCEKVILPPVGELVIGLGDDRVLPLYRTYVMYARGQSLVGKIGYLTEPGHVDHISDQNMFQQLLMDGSETYERTEDQLRVRQFSWPFSRWGCDVRQWKYFLRSMSPRNYLINKVVKFDIRKLKDADVDTVLPSEWSHFAMEKTIERFFNSRRTKRHGLDILEKCFVQLVGSDEDTYSVRVDRRGDLSMIESTRKYPWLLGRGKSVNIEYRRLDTEASSE